jgi:adenine phosphoribosyltransferase
MTDLARYIRDVPDFPRPGVLFKDITPLLTHPEALAAALERMAAPCPRPAAVVAVESRGFVFGTGLALRWQVPLVLARKPGKLPAAVVRETYALEYGEDALEMHTDALSPGRGVVIVDDLLATGGTALATARLVERLGGKVLGITFLVELVGLGGRARLAGYPAHAVLDFEVHE